MARLLQRLGLFVARNKGKVLFSWILAIALLGASASMWAGQTTKTFSLKGQESTVALELMDKKFGSNSNQGSAKVTFEAKGGSTIVAPSAQSYIASKVAELKMLPGVVAVSNPFDSASPMVSADRKAAFANVVYGVAYADITKAEHLAFDNAITTNVNSEISVGASGTATQVAPGSTAKTGELVGLAVALLVLLLTFGSLAAAGMNLITALVGVGMGTLGISLATGFIDLTSTTPVLASMLGLAVGIDYALFIVARFRTELLRTRDVQQAVGFAVATAGSAVITAGLTVILALAGLSVVGIQFLTQMGLAAAATVAIAVIGAITLVPAVLAIFGYKVLSRKQRNFVGKSVDAPIADVRNPIFDGWVDKVVKHPLALVMTIIAVLALATIPFFSLQSSLVPSETPGTMQGTAESTLEKHFGAGVTGPIVIYVEGKNAESIAAQDRSLVQSVNDIAMILPVQMNSDKTAAIVTVIPTSKANSVATQELVSNLRNVVVSEAGTRSYVTGSTAVSVDISKMLNSALPLYLALVGGLALLLLIMVFRSIWVPIIGVFGFLLTIGSSLGATVAVFQWGHLSSLFGLDSRAPLMSITPILAIGILFGLAMDYQVFLVSRMHEAQSHGDDPISAIKHGFHNAAPVVLAAATIMFAVFAGFIPGGDATIKQIAFALAFGIFVDAILVRMIFVPAALTILGARAWAFPKWLNWLPELDVEGHGIERELEESISV